MAANNTTLAWSYIHLQLNTSAPDPIGFAQVSGFYGPGAWAAWFLTLVGSWLAIVKAPGRVDSNMLLYLAGLNWVAADLLRHMIRLHILKQAHNPAWMKEAASVGAAFVVTWWGHFHASAQLAFCFQPVLDVADIDEMQRGLTLMIGSTLSAAALAASSWMLGPLEVSSQIPAIFWNGMEVKEIAQEKIALGHDMALALPASCGFYSLFAYLILATPVIWSKAISENLRDILSTPFRVSAEHLGRILSGYYLVLALFSYIIMAIVFAVRHLPAFWYFLPLYPFLFVLLMFIWPPCVAFQSMGLSIVYIFSAYFHLGSSPSQSCYFMPCAPQSIADMDQSFALFLGIFSLFFIEYGIPYIRKVRKERRDMRLFEQNVRGRIQMTPRTGGASSGSP